MDANLNRLKEGIRVVEDLCRFALNKPQIASRLKNLRHEARTDLLLAALSARDTHSDPLRPTMACENLRADLLDVLVANFKRSQESARSLEELLKLYDEAQSQLFKNIRYELYSIEKLLLLDLPQNSNASNSSTEG